MFDYIARGESRGWTVVVADPHGEDCPHRHLVRLFSLLPAENPLIIVAHSYGAPCSLGMLKAVPAAQKRLQAIALTDGAPASVLLPSPFPVANCSRIDSPSEDNTVSCRNAVDARGLGLDFAPPRDGAR
jgi:hypothetical protein